MIRMTLTPAPVGPQEPPTRAAAIDSWWSLRVARGSLLWTTGTACAVLDEKPKSNIRQLNQRRKAHRKLTAKPS